MTDETLKDRGKLLRYFEVLKSMELEAFAMYKKALPGLPGGVDSDILSGIMRDEQRHADIVQKIIDLLQTA